MTPLERKTLEIMRMKRELAKANNRIAFLEIRVECQEAKEKDILKRLNNYQFPPKMESLRARLGHATKKMKRFKRELDNEYRDKIAFLNFRIEMMRETIQNHAGTVAAVTDELQRRENEPTKPIVFDQGRVFLNSLAVAV